MYLDEEYFGLNYDHVEVEEIFTYTYSKMLGLHVTGEPAARSLNEELIQTELEGIVATSDGFYAMEVRTVFGIEYVPMGKLVIDITNEDEVKSALQRGDLTTSMIDDILFMRQEVLDGNAPYGLVLTILCQSLLPKDMITPFGTNREITYNGRRMRTTFTSATNRLTPLRDVARGTGTRNVASSVTNMAIIIGGTVNSTIGMVDAGVSLLQNFINIVRPPNNVIVANQGDFLQVGVRWNETIQRTYGFTSGNNWMLGLTTMRIAVNRIDTRQHFMVNNSGRESSTNRNVFHQRESAQYAHPWTLADQRTQGLRPLGPLVQPVQWRVHNTTFEFRP